MARRGTFGRQPRTQPNITNTLIAIAREAQNREDQNIVDAWQKGGTVQGKQVTDEMLLEHWSKRLQGLSKDDPMYDMYKNARSQADYAIHESKMTVRYAQGRISDTQMARFYLDWAKKVPKNSEFYRVLQRDGAQFMRAAANKGRAGAARAKELAYQNQQKNLHAKNEAAGEFVLDTLRALAQRGQADYGIVGIIAGPGSGSDLTDFDATDPEQMLRLLSLITPDLQTSPTGRTENRPNDRVLYHDDLGNPITGADVIQKLRKLDPSFTGQLDLDAVKGIITRQLDGIQDRIALADKTGHISDANALRKQSEYISTVGRQVNAWPVEKDYMNLRSQYQSVINNPSATPPEKVAAWEKYSDGLTKLSNDPRIAEDDRFRSALVGEANGTDGTVTLAESFTQSVQTEPNPNGDVAMNKLHIEQLQAQVDAYDSDPVNVHWTTGTYNAQGAFTPVVGGPSIGAATTSDIQQLAGSGGDPKFIYMPTTGGAAIPVLVVDAPVTATARDATGATLKLDNTNPVASVYMFNVGGQQVKVYGFESGDGVKRYSADPPWDQSKVVAQQTQSGIVLDLSRVAQEGTTPGFTLRGKTDKSPGEVYMDPNVAVKSSDPSRATAGFDPTTDFYSPTLAALMSIPDGGATLQKLQKDPTFRAQLEAEAYMSAGYEKVDGVWANGDPSKLTQNMLQNKVIDGSLERGIESVIQAGIQLFDRVSTTPAFKGASTFAGQPRFDEMRDDRDSRLPSDSLKETPMAVFGQLWQPGTNILKGAIQDKDDATRIKQVGQLTIPTFTPPKLDPIVTTTTTTVTPGTPKQTIPTYNVPNAPASQTPTYGPPTKPKPTVQNPGRYR